MLHLTAPIPETLRSPPTATSLAAAFDETRLLCQRQPSDGTGNSMNRFEFRANEQWFVCSAEGQPDRGGDHSRAATARRGGRRGDCDLGVGAVLARDD